MTKKNPLARPYVDRTMGEVRPIRKFWMSETMHDAASGYARSQRSTLSQLIRDQLVDVQREPLNERKMTPYDEPSSTKSVSVAVDDELFYGAKDTAYPTRHSLSSLVRRRILKILETEGLWKSPFA
jgi:hypothetical protein